MKPKEFDDLVRQKFDQNDFAYNPRNWDQLAEQLDGRAKKRSAIMWWLVPLAGIAASVTMAMGITNLLRQPATGNAGTSTAFVQSGNFEKPQALQNEPSNTIVINEQPISNSAKNNNYAHNKSPKKNNAPETFGINLENAIGFASNNHSRKAKVADILIPKKEKKATAAVVDVYSTFKPEAEIAKPVKTSIILSGSMSHGSAVSGYAVGATIRHMINKNVYIESDVAFSGMNNTQPIAKDQPIGGASARISAARNTKTEDVPTLPNNPGPQNIVVNQNESYNLYYAQVSPSIGYKVMKNLSIGAGPDFQQMIGGNSRPANAQDYKGTTAVEPGFDIGLIGKTECAVTKKVKAGVMYRKGINNVLVPTGQYLDRDYLQFQLKYSIFNK